ncbi:hypothetical protein ACFXB3_13955 [Streptomyces sp. NPDC059447]|uniref:hypothetical protein n=1 Tax=Streptomyces sp. NPDC059447 TaxID=3346834 RepID=UPI003682E7DD
MPPAQRRRSTAAAALLAVTLLAGCADTGGAKGKSGGEPALGPVAVNPATISLSFPMDAYTDTDSERGLMDAAQYRLTAQCMARYGFSYEQAPKPAADVAAASKEDRHQNLFGTVDPVYAATYGYAPDAGRPRPPRPTPPQLSDSASTVLFGQRPEDSGRQQADPGPMSDEEAQAADSGLTVGGQKVPAGGCQREGYRKLYTPTKDSVDLLFSFGLASEAHTRAQEDSRVGEVLAKWSECMGKAGYGGVKSPYEVIEKLGLQNDKAGPKAVAVATKDVACKREVNLVGIWAAAEVAYQERLVEEHAQTLALYKKQREARLKLAASLA